MGKIVLAYLMVMNVVAFALYAVDKRRAVQGAWRIPEKTLLLVAFAGGALGSLLAMHLVHHKTRKWYFAYGVPAFLAFHVVLLAFAASRDLV